MIETGDLLVAGISGGADSVCLLLLLDALRKEIDFSLTAVHVEHGIRGQESLRDAAFVEELCHKLDIDRITFHVDVPRYRERTGCSPEEAARELRYACFRQACAARGTEKVVLAHQADDAAETMLFHLARGTGIRGMCGIRPVTEQCFSDADATACADEGDAREGRAKRDPAGEPCGARYPARLTVLRPLLCATREEIRAWLAERGQAYCTDSTNADLAFARNRIREQVLPELAQINAQAVPHMQQFAEQMARLCDALDEAARKACPGIVTYDDAAGAPRIVIACAPFFALSEGLARHLLLDLIGQAAGSRRDIRSDHVEQVWRLMTAQVGAKVSLPGGVTAEKTYDAVVLRAVLSGEVAAPAQPLVPRGLQIPGETVLENGLCFTAELFDAAPGDGESFSEKIPRKKYTKWFDYDKIKDAVFLRSRNAGDYLVTDADGGRKKLNRVFIDEKIPSGERDAVCLLADGDHILWIVGGRISEAYKVTEDTKRILQVRVCGADADGARTDG